MKMVSRYEVKEELDKVNGGTVPHEQEDSNGNRYCKYCDDFTPATYLGTGVGYENRVAYLCNIYKCKRCNQDTYWDRFSEQGYLA